MSVFIYTVYLTLVYMAVCIMILKFLWVFFLYKKYRTTCFSIIKYRVYTYVSKFLTQFMLSEIEYLYAHRGSHKIGLMLPWLLQHSGSIPQADVL